MKKRLMKNWHNFFTIKARLTLWYLLIMALVLSIFSFFLYRNMEQRIYQDVRSDLKAQSKMIMAEMEVEDGEVNGNEMNLVKLSEQISENKTRNSLVAYYSQNGELLKGEKIPKALLRKVNFSPGFFKIDEEDTGDWAILTEAVQQNQKVIGWLSVFRSLEKEEKVLHRLLIILFLGVPLTLLLASAGGYFLAWRALSPINRIIKTAQEISHSNLSRRVEETGTGDEVGNLILTLNQLLDRLEEAFKRQKQFTADASHDLRTPITVIRAQAEEALKRPRSEEEYRQTLDKIVKQIEHMSRLVEQLLQLARADTGKEKLQLEILDMGQLVQIVTEEMREMALQKGLNLVSIIEDKELHLKGDQTKLTQLLVNLIANAIQYTPSGGRITIKIKQMENEIMLRVADTGCGIPKEDQEHIFERFYKVDKSRTRQNGGTGLGLAICHWIVKAHGGRIELTSQPNKGSTFTVFLPKSFA